MSVGDLPSPQQQYNAMMAAADAFMQNDGVNLNAVTRDPSDCDKLAALISAAQSVYAQYCPIA